MALRPCSGVLLEGALTSGMCVGEGGEGRRPPLGLCVRWGRAGTRVLRSTGSGPGARLPPQTPGSWGSGAQFWGAGIHAGECPPSRAGSS